MKWLALKVGGRKISVYVVRPTHPKLEGCDGIYHPDSCAIYISSALELGAREDTLFHELDHVVDDVSGAWHVLRSSFKSHAVATKVGELMTRARVGTWLALLKEQFGFRFPKGPNE